MAENSKIEWTDHTFNPWVGCTKVSPACDHCYAEGWAKRAGKAGGVVWGGERRRTSDRNWRQVLTWNEQAQQEGRRFRVFCSSLADVFDNQVPDEWRADLWRLVLATPHLDWLLLSKRIGNAAAMLQGLGSTLPNVWIGATICNQLEADRDVPKLLATPAAVRFLSVEPMLGPIDLERPRPGPDLDQGGGRMICQPWLIQSGIDWVIVGGESGPGARPMHPDWARSLRDQCAAAGVKFLFKQWGGWTEQDDSGLPGVRTIVEGDPEWDSQAAQCDAFMAVDGELIASLDDAREGLGYRGLVRAGKKTAGRLLDGRTHDEFPA